MQAIMMLCASADRGNRERERVMSDTIDRTRHHSGTFSVGSRDARVRKNE